MHSSHKPRSIRGKQVAQVPESFLWGLLSLGLMNLGALVFFLGRLTEKSKVWDAWVERCEKCNRSVSIMASKEGVSLN